MRKYRLVSKKGEGTFSEVLKAQNIKNSKYYAIKCMKNRFDNIEQVFPPLLYVALLLDLSFTYNKYDYNI